MFSLKILDWRCYFIFRNYVLYYELDVDELNIYKYYYMILILSIILFVEVYMIVYCNI